MNKYSNGKMWDEYDKVVSERDGYKSLVDNLFNECLEALGTPDDFSMAEVPWQLRTMRYKIEGLVTRLGEADKIYNHIIEEQKETIIGSQKVNDDLRKRIVFLEGEVERLRPRWEGIPK